MSVPVGVRDNRKQMCESSPSPVMVMAVKDAVMQIQAVPTVFWTTVYVNSLDAAMPCELAVMAFKVHATAPVSVVLADQCKCGYTTVPNFQPLGIGT